MPHSDVGVSFVMVLLNLRSPMINKARIVTKLIPLTETYTGEDKDRPSLKVIYEGLYSVRS